MCVCSRLSFRFSVWHSQQNFMEDTSFPFCEYLLKPSLLQMYWFNCVVSILFSPTSACAWFCAIFIKMPLQHVLKSGSLMLLASLFFFKFALFLGNFCPSVLSLIFCCYFVLFLVQQNTSLVFLWGLVNLYFWQCKYFSNINSSKTHEHGAPFHWMYVNMFNFVINAL